MTFPRKQQRECANLHCRRLISNHYKNCVRCGTCARLEREANE